MLPFMFLCLYGVNVVHVDDDADAYVENNDYKHNDNYFYYYYNCYCYFYYYCSCCLIVNLQSITATKPKTNITAMSN